MISEIDIRDWERSEQVVKLYDVPRNSIVTPLFDLQPWIKWINFSHIDGMYSFCTLPGTEDVVHLGASTDVYVWKRKNA